MLTSVPVNAVSIPTHRWCGNVARLCLCRAPAQVYDAWERARNGPSRRTFSCQLVHCDRQAKLRFPRWTAVTQRAARGLLRVLCSVPAAQAEAQEGLKRCTKCSVEKPLSEFHINKTVKNGRTSRCKVCYNEAARLRHAKNWAAALMNSDTASPTLGAKRCPKCERVLSRSDFSRSLGNSSGLASECKLCNSKRGKALREARKAAGAQPTVDVKECSSCKQLKPASKFTLGFTSITVLHSQCTECSFSTTKQRTAAMTPEQIQAKREEWTARRRVCRVCKLEQPGSVFYIRMGAFMGQRNTCRSCLSKAERRRRARRKESARETEQQQ